MGVRMRGAGPGCCCDKDSCLLFFDDFNRASIGADWQFGSATYPSVPSWSSTPDGWSISGNQLVCSTAGKWVRPAATNTGGYFPPFDWPYGLVTELDFTYTGSGQLHIDDLSFRFDLTPKKIDLWTRHGVAIGDQPRYSMPYALSSGATYSLRVVNSFDVADPGHPGNVEIWLNGAPFRKTNIVRINQGEISLSGSGSVIIDNYRLSKVWNVFVPDCPQKERGFYPWTDAGTRDFPVQLQIDVTGASYSGCTTCRTNFLPNGTYVLDWITPTSAFHYTNGVFGVINPPFAAYSLAGTFGSCYNRMEIVFMVQAEIGAFLGPATEYVGIAFYNAAVPATNLQQTYLIKNTSVGTQIGYYGHTMQITNPSPSCWWGNLVMTPIY